MSNKKAFTIIIKMLYVEPLNFHWNFFICDKNDKYIMWNYYQHRFLQTKVIFNNSLLHVFVFGVKYCNRERIHILIKKKEQHQISRD
jgi:hypothetical protein